MPPTLKQGEVSSTKSAAIEVKLRQRERLFWAKIVLMMAMGVPLSLFGPLVLGTMFWVVCLFLIKWYPWSWFFWGACAVVIPLLYRMEMRGPGNFLVESVQGDATKLATGLWTLSRAFPGSGLGAAAVAANPRAPAAALVEIFLTGPRMVVSAARQFRAKIAMRDANRTHAARVLAILLTSDRGMATEQIQEGDDLRVVAPTIAYLVFHHWIGLSSDAQKLWVLSDERAELQH